MKLIISVLRRLDLARWIAKNLIGAKHSKRHRQACGICLMIIGVGIIQLATLCDFGFIHFFAEVIGNGLHGLGLIPFVEIVDEFAE